MATTINIHTVLRLSFITTCACLALAHAYDPWKSVLSGGLKDYFNCPPCEHKQCPELPAGCVRVFEAGVCGCCEVCARHSGEPCGFVDSICAPGLECVPTATGSRAMFQQLKESKAVCLPAQRYVSEYTSLEELLNREAPQANDIKRWRY